jgi:hypothetical protein
MRDKVLRQRDCPRERLRRNHGRDRRQVVGDMQQPRHAYDRADQLARLVGYPPKRPGVLRQLRFQLRLGGGSGIGESWDHA